MRLVLAQIEVQAGRPDLNFQTIKQYYLEHQDQADLMVFPELCLPGYLISDLWEDAHFLQDCQEYAEELKALTGECALVFGTVYVDDQEIKGEDGRRRRWNSARIAQRGSWVMNPALSAPHFPKTLMPNYREFDDSRYFYDLRKYALESQRDLETLLQPVELHWVNGSQMKIAPLLCEDSWDSDYAFKPSQILASQGAQLLCNLSCSPYTHNKFQKRNRVLSQQAKALNLSISYCNNVGIQNNGKTLYSFDGRSALYLAQGDVRADLKPWQEGVEVYDLNPQLNDVLSGSQVIGDPYLEEGIAAKTEAIIYSLKNHMKMSGLKKVVIGASGGVDSALSAALFSRVLKPEDIYLVNMPSRYNSDTTIHSARDLAANIGCWYTEVSIEPSVEVTRDQIQGLELGRDVDGAQLTQTLELTSFHFENIQARDRSARILSAIAAAVGGVYPSNANKAETLVGYSTLYGDHGGFMVPIGDLWKEEVFAMCKYLNTIQEIVPPAVFEIPPSAELSDAQDVDAGLGDPLQYEYHDRLFQSWIENWNRESAYTILKAYEMGELKSKLGLKQAIENYFSSSEEFINDLERWWKLFKGMGVVKRVQAPTIIALTRRAFGYDFRESILSPYWGKDYLDLKRKILGSQSE